MAPARRALSVLPPLLFAAALVLLLLGVRNATGGLIWTAVVVAVLGGALACLRLREPVGLG